MYNMCCRYINNIRARITISGMSLRPFVVILRYYTAAVQRMVVLMGKGVYLYDVYVYIYIDNLRVHSAPAAIYCRARVAGRY